MRIPDLTTDYSDYDAKAELTKFFWDRSVDALEQSIQHLCDCDFYTSIEKKLAAGVDLSKDLPELKGNESEAPAILKKLHDAAMTAAVNGWELKGGAAKVFSTSIRAKETEDSKIPSFDIQYSATTDEGITKVHVTTWRRNIEVNVSGNDKAAEAASKKLLMAGMVA